MQQFTWIIPGDHTVGNLLKRQLDQNPAISFAGYKMPHPLKPEIAIHIKSTTNAKLLLREQIQDTILHFSLLEKSFQSELLKWT